MNFKSNNSDLKLSYFSASSGLVIFSRYRFCNRLSSIQLRDLERTFILLKLNSRVIKNVTSIKPVFAMPHQLRPDSLYK